MTMPIAATERPKAAMVAGSESTGPTLTFASAVFVPDPADRPLVRQSRPDKHNSVPGLGRRAGIFSDFGEIKGLAFSLEIHPRRARGRVHIFAPPDDSRDLS